MFDTTSAIANTNDGALYQAERFGDFTYAIPVINGDYTLTLHFAEIYWDAPGQRVFDVFVEGTERISNLDIYAFAGKDTAYEITLPVKVNDGVLNLEFRTDVDNAKLSGLKLLPPGERRDARTVGRIERPVYEPLLVPPHGECPRRHPDPLTSGCSVTQLAHARDEARPKRDEGPSAGGRAEQLGERALPEAGPAAAARSVDLRRTPGTARNGGSAGAVSPVAQLRSQLHPEPLERLELGREVVALAGRPRADALRVPSLALGAGADLGAHQRLEPIDSPGRHDPRHSDRFDAAADASSHIRPSGHDEPTCGYAATTSGRRWRTWSRPCSPAGVTTSARPSRARTSQPRSSRPLSSAAPRCPARWWRRSLQSRHARVSGRRLPAGACAVTPSAANGRRIEQGERAAVERPELDQPIGQRDAERAGEVVVAGAGRPLGGGEAGGTQRLDGRRRRDGRQRLERFGDLHAREPVVAVAAVALDLHQPGGREPSEMGARRGRRHAGDPGQLAGGQRAAAEQRLQHGRPGRIADRGADLRQIRVTVHAASVRARRFAARRSVPRLRSGS